MNFKIIILFLTLIIPSLFASEVEIGWNPPDTTNSYGYIISYGFQSGQYSQKIDIGTGVNYNIYTLSNLISNTQYYFALQDYNSVGQTSDFSNEISYYTENDGNTIVYVGVELDYGTNLTNLNKSIIQITNFSSAPIGQFYRQSLIIQSSPIDGSSILLGDTNNYTFTGVNFQYGTNISQLTSQIIGLRTFTNVPNQLYRGTLILQATPFNP